MINAFDVECAPNWFLLLFKCRETGQVYRWERLNDKEEGRSPSELKAFMRQGTLISFNGLHYDQWIIAAYLASFSNQQMFDVSTFLIKGDNLAPWRVGDEFGIDPPTCSHIDIMPVAPSVASLKIYGGRLDAPKLQGLPFDPEVSIDPTPTHYTYCVNDLDTTLILFEALRPQLQLRRAMSKEYGINLLSKSDPAIAELVIKSELNKQGIATPKYAVKAKPVYRYEPPENLNAFSSPELEQAYYNACKAEFKLSAKGKLLVPYLFRKQLVHAGMNYQMGSGGLHSCEKKRSADVRTDRVTHITDLDVASYYPSIILNNKYSPESLWAFPEVYERIYHERIEAKHGGDKTKADSLKIVLNSSFGKFGSEHSALYDPQLLIQTVVTGQLSLLLLIDMIDKHTNGRCKVISANTDGVTVTSPNENYRAMLDEVASWWMKDLDYELEAVEYTGVWSQDVNNYLALTTDGKWKGKGVFADEGLSKNPKFRICTYAIQEYLAHGIPIETTITDGDNPADYMAIQKITGGGVWRGEEIGGIARWYIGEGGSEITRAGNGYKIGMSDGAILANELPKRMMKDLDYGYYIQRTKDLLKGVGL